ncbi:MAG: metallophosphoesterase [Magnetococcales bacterium]|nr:metallophosphoesterase [Magnetococcales bacterium]
MSFMKLRPDSFYAALAETPEGIVCCRPSWRKERERRERIVSQGIDWSGFDRSWSGTGMKKIRSLMQKTPLYRQGVLNSLKIHTVTEELFHPNLPAACDGYTILHLSDPHFGTLPEIDDAILQATDNQQCDLCLLTGDYRASLPHSHDHALAKMRLLLQGIPARDGFVATLGNHDRVCMVNPLEEMGYRVLINEEATVHRQNAAIHLLGLDDTYFFPTRMALAKLSAPRQEGFNILLVHSPEIAAIAARHGFDLYLCGHTHGGQVCWPTGKPIMTNMRQGCKQHGQGLWRHGTMIGRTSNGLGSSSVPIRFFNHPECVRIVLRAGRI